MRPVVPLVALAALILTAVAAPVGAGTTPQVVAVHPNPVADGDRGEFAVVRFPVVADLAAYTLTDGEDRVPLPNRTVEGRVVLAADPGAIARNATGRLIRLDAFPALANDGDRVRLVRENRTVAGLRYGDAPEGETYRNGTWHAPAATDRPVVHAGPGTARAFVLPDAPRAPLSAVRNASDRVLLAGYTLTSARVTRALLAAGERGARVRVLVDGAPVGGLSRIEATRLNRLAAAGIEVRVVGGPRAPYAFHHAKYVVADGRATVLTENWKPAGTGGASSRGWGVTLSDRDAVRALAATFREDADAFGAVDWRRFRRGKTFEPSNASRGSYPANIAPVRVPYQNASVLVAPDNAERAVVRRLRRANESVRVLQMSVGDAGQPFLAATVAAARRGVETRVLLSGAWYAAEENRAVVERLNALADREGLPLSARLARPRGRFEKVHAKGAVVDDTVLLGSLNWNNHSARENREVVVALRGPRVADYYRRAFDRDWRASGERLPVGLPVALAVGAAACLLAARRLRFES
ncbi:phospholipase D-like domain-containing protein [Halorarius halobius]|uniref:phospholipase D-like domain-containing protein n=1 Tax=Halorarius halobius TaxID=2962671 RepID=UPI0020CFB205|nr:phospholipase D-like domain-containing protein [Halorarius halobius]